MKIGIIGSGHVGGNLTRRLSGLGHDVSVANSRGPDTLRDLAAETGATPTEVGRVANGADVVIVSVPEKAVPELPDDLLDGMADGGVVIDTGNYYPERDGRIEPIEHGVPESRWVEQQLGHPVVKAFNGVLAQNLVEKPKESGEPGRLGVAVASDDADAKQTVMRLVDELGFDPVDDGLIEDSWRQQPGTPWYGKGLNAYGVRQALAAAQPGRPAESSA